MQKLKTVDADTLLSTPLPANQFVVERLLPQGLHILAGASKVGKSWLALWLCLCVAKGEPVWGLTTARGTVLYLCLEDSLSRIQGRLFQLTENAPAALHFATMAGNIGKGLEEQIEGFLQMHRDTVLVVIDTLQKVRISNSAANPYANDYQDLSSLKALADRYRVAILAIHHIRKMQDDDPFNRISGTTGISGVADTNLVLLKQGRSGVDATLHCVGRDVEYQELHLKFQNCRWLLTEPLEEQKQEPVRWKSSAWRNFSRALRASMALPPSWQRCGRVMPGSRYSPASSPKSWPGILGNWTNWGFTSQPAAPGRAAPCTCAVTAVTGVTGKIRQSQYPICCHSRHTCHRRSLRPCEDLCGR